MQQNNVNSFERQRSAPLDYVDWSEEMRPDGGAVMVVMVFFAAMGFSLGLGLGWLIWA